MKNVIKLCMVGIVFMSLLGACSFGKTQDPRNGAVIIGEEQRLKEIVNQHKSEIKSNDLYIVKRAESDGKQVLIIDQKTAEGVMKKGVLRKTDHRGVTSDSPITSLPTIPKGKIVMFTTNKDKEIKEIKVNDKKIKVQYEDDISLGRVRIPTYEEIILIVDATTFKDLPGTETYMVVLHFNKSYGENTEFNSDNLEELQIWYEWKNLLKI